MTAEAIRVAQVDVFTTEPYSGAPAAVCIVTSAREAGWMARVSREMACPNTAFVVPRDQNDGYDIRWFTAGGVEVALCGHATLATAHVLNERKLLSADSAVSFHSQSGVLTAAKRTDGAIEMSFPIERAEQMTSPPPQIAQAFGSSARWIGRNRLDYLVELESEEALRALKPDLTALSEVETRGFIVTARASPMANKDYDYVLRFFAPRVGVTEDMVTGTAHCALAPYWSDRLDSKTSFIAYQASSRGGFVEARLSDGRVMIAGHAVTVLRGELLA